MAGKRRRGAIDGRAPLQSIEVPAGAKDHIYDKPGLEPRFKPTRALERKWAVGQAAELQVKVDAGELAESPVRLPRERGAPTLAGVWGMKSTPRDAVLRSLWRPDEVLDVHTQLAERYAHPSEHLLDFLAAFIENALSQNGGRAKQMFWNIALSEDADRDRSLAAKISKGLHAAVTYEVTADMSEIMWQVLDKTVVERMEEATLPAPAGFTWFDQPLRITDVNGVSVACRAVSWELCHWQDGRHAMSGAWIVLWAHTGDAGTGTLWNTSSFPDQAAYVEQRLGSMVIMHSVLLPFGVPFVMDDTDGDSKRESAKQVLGMVHLLWMFLGMEITTTQQLPVSRAVRRRAMRESLKHYGVNVVLMRRLRHPDDDRPVSHHEVDWSCRWVVQGHYRHLESYDQAHHHALAENRGTETVCGACGGRLTYIRPYVKGPDGAPLRAAGLTLHKLAR